MQGAGMQNNVPARHELRSPEGKARFDFPLSRLGRISLRNAKVAQKIRNGCRPTSRTKRSTFMVGRFLLSWQRAPWTACFIAVMTILQPAQSQQTKPAEPNVAA